MAILELENTVKMFGDYRAVDNVSFEVEQDKIFGILGPNGAGKTTTIRMITNILSPDEGEIRIFGEPVGRAHQNNIGYLPEERGLYKKIKVIDQLTYFAQLKGMDKNSAKDEAKKWLRDLDAYDWADKKIQELSKGMQQKVQFISTILHNPDLIIFDELFSGFDPVNVETLKQIILDLKKQGKTIFLSTHVMEQAEQICDDIVLINNGRIVLSGNVRKIKRNYSKDNVIIEFEGDDRFLDELKDVKMINRSQNRAEFRISESAYEANDIINLAINNGAQIYHFELEEPSLHEIFIDAVSKKEEVEDEN